MAVQASESSSIVRLLSACMVHVNIVTLQRRWTSNKRPRHLSVAGFVTYRIKRYKEYLPSQIAIVPDELFLPHMECSSFRQLFFQSRICRTIRDSYYSIYDIVSTKTSIRTAVKWISKSHMLINFLSFSCRLCTLGNQAWSSMLRLVPSNFHSFSLFIRTLNAKTPFECSANLPNRIPMLLRLDIFPSKRLVSGKSCR
jgi:hypothetical protein